MNKLSSALFVLLLFFASAFSQAPLYSYTFDNSNYSVAASAICKSHAGGTFMVGELNRGMFGEIDSAGNFLWSKDGFNAYYRAVVPASNNSGYYITGTAFDSINLHQGALCSKIDNNGNVQWASIYYGTSIVTYYNALCLAECMDHNMIFGVNDFSTGAIVKIDSSGNFLWSQKIMANGNRVEINCIKENNDSTIMISGSEPGFYSNSFFAKLDKNGNLIWAKTYYTGSSTSSGIISFEAIKNGYILTGGFDSEVAFKTDTAGSPLWSRKFYDTEAVISAFNWRAPKSHSLSDSTYLVLAGSATDAYGALVIIKVDLNGNCLRKAFFYANPIDFYENDDKSLVIMGHGPLNLVAPHSTSGAIPQIELTHCDSTLGDTLNSMPLCVDNQFQNLNIDTTLIGMHNIAFSTSPLALTKLNIGLSLHNDTMNRNSGCVGLVGSIDEPPFVPMLISPNPAGNRFTINSSHINEIGTLIIYDLSGRIILQEDVQFVDGKYSRDINFENGIYLVKVQTSVENQMGELVISK